MSLPAGRGAQWVRSWGLMKKGIREEISRPRGGNEDESIRTSFIVGFLRSCSQGSGSIMASGRKCNWAEIACQGKMVQRYEK